MAKYNITERKEKEAAYRTLINPRLMDEMSERILNVDHNEAIEYNGRKFRSKLELQTAKTLDVLGIPYDYETRKIVLQDSFKCPFQKKKIR